MLCLFVLALVRGEVRRIILDRGGKTINKEILFKNLGRKRNMVSAPDGSLLLTTDRPKGKLIKVVPNN